MTPGERNGSKADARAGALSHSKGSSWKIATRGVPSFRMTPRYIPEQFNGMVTERYQIGQLRSSQDSMLNRTIAPVIHRNEAAFASMYSELLDSHGSSSLQRFSAILHLRYDGRRRR